jgi:hypothetical protein
MPALRRVALRSPLGHREVSLPIQFRVIPIRSRRRKPLPRIKAINIDLDAGDGGGLGSAPHPRIADCEARRHRDIRAASSLSDSGRADER